MFTPLVSSDQKFLIAGYSLRKRVIMVFRQGKRLPTTETEDPPEGNRRKCIMNDTAVVCDEGNFPNSIRAF